MEAGDPVQNKGNSLLSSQFLGEGSMIPAAPLTKEWRVSSDDPFIPSQSANPLCPLSQGNICGPSVSLSLCLPALLSLGSSWSVPRPLAACTEPPDASFPRGTLPGSPLAQKR